MPPPERVSEKYRSRATSKISISKINPVVEGALLMPNKSYAKFAWLHAFLLISVEKLRRPRVLAEDRPPLTPCYTCILSVHFAS